MNRRAALLLAGLTLAGCGPVQFFRTRGEVRLAEVKLAESAPRVGVMHIALGAGLQVGGKTSGEHVDELRADWRDTAEQFDGAFGELRTDSLTLAPGDDAARYTLQPELISVVSEGDVWFGYWTETCVLFTLWDRREKRMLERFSVSGKVAGDWNVGDASTVVAVKSASYLAARFRGQAVDEKSDP